MTTTSQEHTEEVVAESSQQNGTRLLQLMTDMSMQVDENITEVREVFNALNFTSDINESQLHILRQLEHLMLNIDLANTDLPSLFQWINLNLVSLANDLPNGAKLEHCHSSFFNVLTTQQPKVKIMAAVCSLYQSNVFTDAEKNQVTIHFIRQALEQYPPPVDDLSRFTPVGRFEGNGTDVGFYMYDDAWSGGGGGRRGRGGGGRRRSRPQDFDTGDVDISSQDLAYGGYGASSSFVSTDNTCDVNAARRRRRTDTAATMAAAAALSNVSGEIDAEYRDVDVLSLQIGEAGRASLKSLISQRCRELPVYKSRVAQIGQVKYAKLADLLRMAKECDLVPQVVALHKAHMSRPKQRPSQYSTTGCKSREGPAVPLMHAHHPFTHSPMLPSSYSHGNVRNLPVYSGSGGVSGYDQDYAYQTINENTQLYHSPTGIMHTHTHTHTPNYLQHDDNIRGDDTHPYGIIGSIEMGHPSTLLPISQNDNNTLPQSALQSHTHTHTVQPTVDIIDRENVGDTITRDSDVVGSTSEYTHTHTHTHTHTDAPLTGCVFESIA
eukprot:GHVR01120826.1.p1 GENE.GHVR01120826.1~~GHVR01120826.1.p1  ORF type:complete len:551 (-),score=197.88 GHVR01120826.1:12-1664(-)